MESNNARVNGNEGGHTHHQNPVTSSLDACMKKVVVTNYRGNEAHLDFTRFFVLNARVLKLMVLQTTEYGKNNIKWIEEQRRLLHLENKASNAAQFDFVPERYDIRIYEEETHDLSTADLFH